MGIKGAYQSAWMRSLLSAFVGCIKHVFEDNSPRMHITHGQSKSTFYRSLHKAGFRVFGHVTKMTAPQIFGTKPFNNFRWNQKANELVTWYISCLVDAFSL